MKLNNMINLFLKNILNLAKIKFNKKKYNSKL